MPGPLRPRPRRRDRRATGAAAAEPTARRGRPAGCAGSRRRPTGATHRAPTTPTRRARSATGCCAALLAGERPRRHHRGAQGLRSCAAWAARASPPARSGSWSPAGGHAEVRHLQRRRVRARAPSRTARSWPSSRTWCSRGCCSGCWSTGAEEGWVFIRHEYGPEEAVLREELERAARRGRAQRGRARVRRAPRGRHLHLPRRLHPRRGVGAPRVHGGPPRRAAQQAAVPRHLRALGPAHADELGRDVRRRAGDRRARRGVVEGAGRQRRRAG